MKPEGRTRQRVRELTAQGLTPRQIALALGLSTQRVHQHLAKIRAADEAEHPAQEQSV